MKESSVDKAFGLATQIQYVAISYTVGELLAAIGGVLHDVVISTDLQLRAEMAHFVADYLRTSANVIEDEHSLCGDLNHASKTHEKAS